MKCYTHRYLEEMCLRSRERINPHKYHTGYFIKVTTCLLFPENFHFCGPKNVLRVRISKAVKIGIWFLQLPFILCTFWFCLPHTPSILFIHICWKPKDCHRACYAPTSHFIKNTCCIWPLSHSCRSIALHTIKERKSSRASVQMFSGSSVVKLLSQCSESALHIIHQNGGNLCDCHRGTVVGSMQAGLGISVSGDLLRFSCSTVSRVYTVFTIQWAAVPSGWNSL